MQPAWSGDCGLLLRRSGRPCTSGRVHIRGAFTGAVLWPATINSGQERIRMDVVVVQSPTKAKNINKYLGAGYRVLPSYGHVRDLPEKDGSVLPDEDFRIIYELLADREKRVAEIARALKAPTTSTWRPTRTAKARRSPGTCSPRSRSATRSTGSASGGWCSTRSPSARCSRRCASRATCTMA